MAKAKKDIQKIIDQLESQGWTVTASKGNGHWRCVAPGGSGIVFMSATPSDSRSLKNSKAALRRLGARLT